MRLAVGLTAQTIVGAQDFYTRQSGGLLSIVPLGTSRWGYCSWCTGQSGVWHQIVRCSRPDILQAILPFVSWTSLDLHNVFF